jgi:DNA-binding HxlR family transcriptional regulator
MTTTMRTYGDGCAIAQALDLVGERWALLVVRELLLGPKRYTDLRRGLPNASPNVLSQRLGELERAGVLRRRKLPPPAGSRVYELTEWGRELEQTVISLGHWAARSPSGLASDAPVGVDSMILALRSRFNADAVRGLRAHYELGLGEDRFRIEVGDDEIEVARGGADQSDATIDTDPDRATRRR